MFEINSLLYSCSKVTVNQAQFCIVLSQSLSTIRMADAETLLMETTDQNGNEGEGDQNGAEQELMMGEDGEDNGTDGGKIDASREDDDAG